MSKKIIGLTAILAAAALVLTGCPAPTPQIIEVPKEVVVEKQVVQTVEVIKEVPVEKVVKETVEIEKIVEVEKVVAPAQPSEVTIVLPEEPPNLDWGYVGLSHLPITRNAYEVLVTRDPETGELAPELALSWEQLDESTWRFKLRQGVMFHDGEPFNAEAAAWNINTLSDPELAKHTQGNLGDMDATVVDEYTIDVKTPAPDPIVPRRLYWAHMASPKAIEADPDFTTMVGTGAYKLVAWDRGEKVVLEANPDYWGGAPTLQKATFIFRSETAVRTAMIQTEEAHIAAWLAPQDTGPIIALGGDIPETPMLRLYAGAPLSDLRVRKAMDMALDRESLARVMFQGYATPAALIITPDVAGYNKNIEVTKYDPEGARALIEEARAEGVPVDDEITIVGRIGIYPNSTEVMEAVQGWWQDVGLNVKLEMLDVAAWADKANKADFKNVAYVIQLSHGNEAGDSAFTSGYFDSTRWNPIWPDETMDELIHTAEKLAGVERQTAWEAFWQYERDNMVIIIPMVHLQAIWGVTSDIDWAPRFDNLVLVKEMQFK